jgi:hypothetical protein
MSGRLRDMREQLHAALVANGTPGDWSHILKQIGMFTYTGLTRMELLTLDLICTSSNALCWACCYWVCGLACCYLGCNSTTSQVVGGKVPYLLTRQWPYQYGRHQAQGLQVSRRCHSRCGDFDS